MPSDTAEPIEGEIWKDAGELEHLRERKRKLEAQEPYNTLESHKKTKRVAWGLALEPDLTKRMRHAKDPKA